MGGLGDWARALETWLEPFLARWATGAPAHGPALPGGPARPGRAQEPAADGGPARAERPRPAAALHRQPGLGRRAAAAALLVARRTRSSAGRTRCWWSTTPPCRRRASSRSAWRPQYCGGLGKQANCQALVSLTLARGEVPVPLGLRLFLPEAWTADPDAAPGPACPRSTGAPWPRPTSRWRRSTGSSPPACASAACWPTPATG